MSLWKQEFGEIGAVLKILERYGVTRRELDLIRRFPKSVGKETAELIKNRALRESIVHESAFGEGLSLSLGQILDECKQNFGRLCIQNSILTELQHPLEFTTPKTFALFHFWTGIKGIMEINDWMKELKFQSPTLDESLVYIAYSNKRLGDKPVVISFPGDGVVREVRCLHRDPTDPTAYVLGEVRYAEGSGRAGVVIPADNERQKYIQTHECYFLGVKMS